MRCCKLQFLIIVNLGDNKPSFIRFWIYFDGIFVYLDFTTKNRVCVCFKEQECMLRWKKKELSLAWSCWNGIILCHFWMCYFWMLCIWCNNVYIPQYTHTRTSIQKPQIIVTTMKRCTNYPNRPPNHLIHSNVRKMRTFLKCLRHQKTKTTNAHTWGKKTLTTFVTNKSWNAAGHKRRKTQTITMKEREKKIAYIVHNAHVLAIISSRNLFQSTILSSLI